MAFAAPPAAAADLVEAATRIIEQANRFREAEGRQPQTVSPALEEAAREFARFMARTGKYGHSADGRQPAERAAAHGYDYCIIRENIAYLYRSGGSDAATLASEMVEGWKKSPQHRANMLDPAATQTGVAVAQSESGRYFGVQLSGRPKSAAIRFSVRNTTEATVKYRAGERSFSLAPRAVRSHLVCRPVALEVAQAQLTERAADGASYVLMRRNGSLTVRSGPL